MMWIKRATLLIIISFFFIETIAIALREYAGGHIISRQKNYRTRKFDLYDCKYETDRIAAFDGTYNVNGRNIKDERPKRVIVKVQLIENSTQFSYIEYERDILKSFPRLMLNRIQNYKSSIPKIIVASNEAVTNTLYCSSKDVEMKNADREKNCHFLATTAYDSTWMDAFNAQDRSFYSVSNLFNSIIQFYYGICLTRKAGCISGAVHPLNVGVIIQDGQIVHTTLTEFGYSMPIGTNETFNPAIFYHVPDPKEEMTVDLISTLPLRVLNGNPPEIETDYLEAIYTIYSMIGETPWGRKEISKGYLNEETRQIYLNEIVRLRFTYDIWTIDKCTSKRMIDLYYEQHPVYKNFWHKGIGKVAEIIRNNINIGNFDHSNSITLECRTHISEATVTGNSSGPKAK